MRQVIHQFSRRRAFGLLTALAAAGLAACGNSDSPGGSDPELRSTTAGMVRGTNDEAGSGTYAWKGIPFAKPPVGALRWKAPAEPDAWSGTLDASRFGAACLQNGRIYGPGANNTYDETIATTLNTPVGSEDCLTLNVWRPATGTRNLPVIVFAYGGSNISGYTADPVYDGAALARAANAVVVTVNYRVGPLGFFNMAALKSGSNAAEDSGNFALLDLIQALKYVKANAAAFGGDAGNVTFMGQSAGAINVWALLASPMAEGLFHKAVPLSGGISIASNLPAGSIPTLSPASVYAGQSAALLAALLVADGTVASAADAPAYIAGRTPEQIAGYMRAKDGPTLLSVLLASGLTGSGPIPDGALLPTDPITAIGEGKYNQMPVLAGNTTDEGKLFAPFLTLLGGPPGFIVGDAARFTMMANYDPDAAPALTEADIIHPDYLPSGAPGTGWTAKASLLGEVFMTRNRVNVLDTLRTRQDNVWFYEFKWAQQPAPWNTVYGAAHAFDLPFLFGNFGPSLFANATNSTANEPGRMALSAAMMASLGAFARTGDPNTAVLGTQWQPWPRKFIFDADLQAARLSAE